jgi:hypothetical protein
MFMIRPSVEAMDSRSRSGMLSSESTRVAAILAPSSPSWPATIKMASHSGPAPVGFIDQRASAARSPSRVDRRAAYSGSP